MIRLHIELYYLDIGVEVVEMFEKLKGVLLYARCEYASAISRGPDDMILGFVYCMTTFPESHYSSVPNYQSSGLPPPPPGWSLVLLRGVSRKFGDILLPPFVNLKS